MGSANLDWRALEHIVELGVRIEHAGFASELAALFDHDWHVATAALGVEAPVVPARRSHALTVAAAQGGGEADVRLVTASPGLGSGPGEGDLPHLVALIDGAQEELRATTLTCGSPGATADPSTPCETPCSARRRVASECGSW